MKRFESLAITIIAVVATLAQSGPSHACQQLPWDPQPGGTIPCRVDTDVSSVKWREDFKFWFTVTNSPIGEPYSPPFLDDLEYEARFSHQGGNCPAGKRLNLQLNPNVVRFVLDEAWSPHANDPTSHTQEVDAQMLIDGDVAALYMWATACDDPLCSTVRSCAVSLCLPKYDDPTTQAPPTAHLVVPLRAADSGTTSPYELQVQRNSYPSGVPLTVRVIRENLSDPLDLFPVEPSGALAGGLTFTEDEATLEFQCTSHFPCFTGVENVFHVTISDGPNIVWDSREFHPFGIGRTLVDRAPLARQELIAIDDDSGDGILGPDEHGVIHMRLYARNGFFASSLTAVRLISAIPAGLTITGHELHYHDNPMDEVAPTPAELAATGTVTINGGSVQVDTTTLEPRFDQLTSNPPTIFRNLFEVELSLETPPGGFPAGTDLTFPGVRVTATSETGSLDETSSALVIEIRDPARTPNPVPALLATRAGSDVRLNWQDSQVEPLHDPAETYTVFKTAIDADSVWRNHATVPNTAATTEEHVDPNAASAAPSLQLYKITATNAEGDSGNRP